MVESIEFKEALQPVKVWPSKCFDSQTQMSRLPENVLNRVENEEACEIPLWGETAQVFGVQCHIRWQLGSEETQCRQCLQFTSILGTAKKVFFNWIRKKHYVNNALFQKIEKGGGLAHAKATSCNFPTNLLSSVTPASWLRPLNI